MVDALEPAKVIAMQYREVIKGVTTAETLARSAEVGDWPMPVEAVIDVKSVFDSIIAPDARLPVGESLIAVLQSVREQFAVGLIQKVWWVDTVEMLADGLTLSLIHI